MSQRVRVMKFDGTVVWKSMHRLLFGQRPLKRHKGRNEKRVAARREANKLARRQRRINRRNAR